MKNNKALAIALSAGLVLGGTFVVKTTNVAYAAESKPWTEIEDIAKPIEEKESKPWTEIEDIAKPIEKEDTKSIPLTELEPSNPKKLGEDDKEIIDPTQVNPTPVLPEEDKKDDSKIVVPVDEEKEEGKETECTTSKEVDDLIKEIDERNQEILDEMKNVDSSIVDENKEPSEEEKKPEDKDKKDEESEAQPEEDKDEKVVAKKIIKEAKEVVKAPAASHNNPKTGVADLSAVAGTLAVSMAGIVATKKKED